MIIFIANKLLYPALLGIFCLTNTNLTYLIYLTFPSLALTYIKLKKNLIKQISAVFAALGPLLYN
jgi:hypothetical protein